MASMTSLNPAIGVDGATASGRSIEAGWNQNLADWRFMFPGAGRGLRLRRPDGRWRASSLILPLGQRLAWISMVLVTRERRRSGLGTRRC